MTNLTALQSLRDRVANATGPDREIDAALCEAFCLYPAGTERVINTDGASTAWAGNAIWWEALPLTASIDAALAWVGRVLPGWKWSIDTFSTGATASVNFLSSDGEWTGHVANASTPVLAIILAGLDALIAKEKTDV